MNANRLDGFDQTDMHSDKTPPELAHLAVNSIELTPATVRLWNAFAGLDPLARRNALSLGVVEPGVAGQRLSPSDHLTIVIYGCVRIGPAGSTLAASIAGPGALLSLGARTFEADWLSDGEVYKAPLAEWLDAAGASGLEFAVSASEKARAESEHRLACSLSHRALPRLANMLLTMREATGSDRIEVSQAKLAAMLSLRRTTVNGGCREFERAGATRTVRTRIQIRDVPRLTAFACGCRSAAR